MQGMASLGRDLVNSLNKTLIYLLGHPGFVVYTESHVFHQESMMSMHQDEEIITRHMQASYGNTEAQHHVLAPSLFTIQTSIQYVWLNYHAVLPVKSSHKRKWKYKIITSNFEIKF